MVNSIYYTFSTIPQVLAGAVALFGVFVLYKIQVINSQLIGLGDALLREVSPINDKGRIRKYKKILKDNFIYIERLQKAIYRKDIIGIKRWIYSIVDEVQKFDSTKTDVNLSNHGKRTVGNHKKQFELIEKYKKGLIITTICAITWSSLTILYTIIILPFTEKIKDCPNIYFIIGIMSLAVALFIMIIIIIISLSKTFKYEDFVTKTWRDYIAPIVEVRKKLNNPNESSLLKIMNSGQIDALQRLIEKVVKNVKNAHHIFDITSQLKNNNCDERIDDMIGELRGATYLINERHKNIEYHKETVDFTSMLNEKNVR